MTEVATIREAYNLITPMKLHKFGLSINTSVAFVLARSKDEATKLIKASMCDDEVPLLKYLGAKDLSELNPCVMLNQFLPF